MSRTFPVDWKALALTPTHVTLVQDIVRYLRLTGWVVLQTPKGGIPGEPGAADLFAFKARRVFFIEVKVGRDKLSVAQLRFFADMRAQGFECIEARSLDEVMAAAVQTSAKGRG